MDGFTIGVSDWQQSQQEISKNWIGIANLQSGTSYEVRLSVTNGVNTASSDIYIIKTKGIRMYNLLEFRAYVLCRTILIRVFFIDIELM